MEQNSSSWLLMENVVRNNNRLVWLHYAQFTRHNIIMLNMLTRGRCIRLRLVKPCDFTRHTHLAHPHFIASLLSVVGGSSFPAALYNPKQIVYSFKYLFYKDLLYFPHGFDIFVTTRQLFIRILHFIDEWDPFPLFLFTKIKTTELLRANTDITHYY